MKDQRISSIKITDTYYKLIWSWWFVMSYSKAFYIGLGPTFEKSYLIRTVLKLKEKLDSVELHTSK
jgi:hypothetical protein